MTIDESWYQKPSGVRTDISAGGVVIRLEAGVLRVALVSEAGLSHYFLPKGRVESGEDLQTAARREIEEEAGLSE
jgi:8-oxo-dGTP pyrophosphatase MutT (NUDIX family)